MQIKKYFGPPGTGKTTLLLGLIEEELAVGTPADRIAYLSFTNAACDEAVDRAMKKFDLPKESFRWFSTIHSVCYRLLGVNRSQLVRGPQDLALFSQLVGVAFTSKKSYSESDDFDAGGHGPGNRMLEFDHDRRSRLETMHEAYGQWPEPLPYVEVQRFGEAYTLFRQDEGLLDFTDLLERVNEPLDVDVVFVDEAQDLSKLQWRALHIIAAKAKKMIIAGDDDQAIFTWAGADPTALIEHEGEVHVLDQSYRLPRTIYDIAVEITKRIPNRQEKTWAPRDEEGEVTWEPSLDSALMGIPDDGDVFILYRSHYQMRQVEKVLREKGTPYSTIWGHARGMHWAQAIIAWERLRARKKEVTSSQALEAFKAHKYKNTEVIRQLERMDNDVVVTFGGLGVDLEQAPWFKALDKMNYFDVMYIKSLLQYHGAMALTDEPRIRLSTMHSAKGGEADHVVLFTEMSQRCFALLDSHPGAEERVFYVGATRARNSLAIVGSGNPIFPRLSA